MNRAELTVAQEDCCCNIASVTMSAVSSNRVSPRYDFDPKTEVRELIENDARVSPNLGNSRIRSVTKDICRYCPIDHLGKRDYGLTLLNELGGNVVSTERSPAKGPSGTYSSERRRDYAQLKCPHTTAQLEGAHHCSDTG